jgi:hypothetical protein
MQFCGDGLFYKTSGRKNQTMEPLRTLLLGKDYFSLVWMYLDTIICLDTFILAKSNINRRE